MGLLAWLLSILLYSPRLTLFLSSTAGTTRRDDLLAQCLDPFTRTLDEPLLFYRIVQPLIAHALHLCGSRSQWQALLGSPGLAYLALIATLACLHWALAQRFSSSLALLTTFGLATTQVSQWTNIYWGHPDSLSLLPAAVMLCSRRAVVFWAATAVGVLNDERFVLALPFLFLWWWRDDRRLVAFLRSCAPQLLAIALAAVVVVLVRAALLYGWVGPGIQYQWGKTFSDYAARLLMPSTWPGLLLMVAMAFRWLWIGPLVFVLRSLFTGVGMREGLYLASLLLVLLASFVFSADVSRNLAFAFPLVPVALQSLIQDHALTDRRLRHLLGILLGLNVITPAATFFELPASFNPLQWGSLYLPLPVNLWRWLSLRGQG